MKKNVASQKIGCQMVSSVDGSAFTAAVTVAVTGDAGTQATGSVSSGACTHEGNGYHTYAPAQAETNYDLIAFTFTGTNAVPSTVQIYTSFPQTGDSYDTLTAAQSEPVQGTPSATASVASKIAFLYKAWRNRVAQTATTYSLYNDDASTVDHKATVSDDGTTFGRTEITTGP